MPDVLNNDDLNALAAEYVLGTLDYEERKGATSLLEVDHAFRGLVRIWERRFGELHLMVEPVEPDPKVWDRIRGRLGEQLAALAPPPEAAEETSETPMAPDLPDGEGATLAAEGSMGADEAPSISPAVERASDSTANLIRELEEATRLITPQPESVTPRQRLIERDAVVSDEAAEPTPRPVRRWRLFAVMMSLIALALAGLIGAWRFAPEMLPELLRASSLLHLAEPQAPPPLPKPRRPPPPDFDE
jgi:hypothetical protein